MPHTCARSCRHSVVVVFALGVGVVLDYKVTYFLLDARPPSAVYRPLRSCVGRCRFLGYRIARVDPVCVDINRCREVYKQSVIATIHL
jgi:hypothetical protein